MSVKVTTITKIMKFLYQHGFSWALFYSGALLIFCLIGLALILSPQNEYFISVAQLCQDFCWKSLTLVLPESPMSDEF